MQIHNVKRTTKLKTQTQVGRGGKRGKTSGRGTKGQKARSGHKIRPAFRDIIKKIPKLRGRGKNKNVSSMGGGWIRIRILPRRLFCPHKRDCYSGASV